MALFGLYGALLATLPARVVGAQEPPPPPGTASEAPRIAAFIIPADPADAELADNLTDVLIADLQAPGATFVGRDEFKAQLGLGDREALACAGKRDCAADAAQRLRVQRLVIGTVSRGVGDERVLTVTVVEPGRTGEGAQHSTLRRAPDLPALVASVRDVAGRLAAGRPLEEAAPPPPAPPPTAPLVPAPAEPPPRRSRLLEWTLVGLGGAAVAGGLFFSLRARDRSKQVEDIAASRTGAAPLWNDVTQQLESEGKSAERNAILLYGVGGALEAAAALLWVLRRDPAPPHAAAPGLRARVMGTGLMLEGSF